MNSNGFRDETPSLMEGLAAFEGLYIVPKQKVMFRSDPKFTDGGASETNFEYPPAMQRLLRAGHKKTITSIA